MDTIPWGACHRSVGCSPAKRGFGQTLIGWDENALPVHCGIGRMIVAVADASEWEIAKQTAWASAMMIAPAPAMMIEGILAMTAERAFVAVVVAAVVALEATAIGLAGREDDPWAYRRCLASCC